MPLSIRVRLLLVVAAMFSAAAAAEYVDDEVNGDEKGQGHVDFSVESTDEQLSDINGQDHVDFDIDGAGSGQEHVNFSVDPSAAYAVEARLLVGDVGVGVEFREGGDRGQGHVSFRMAVLPDGVVEVNGVKLAVCDPAAGCRISLGWRPDTCVATLLVADAGGVVCSAQCALSAMPEEVDVAAEDICSLSVARQ